VAVDLHERTKDFLGWTFGDLHDERNANGAAGGVFLMLAGMLVAVLVMAFLPDWAKVLAFALSLGLGLWVIKVIGDHQGCACRNR
jgi:hypothetical protein